MVMDDEIRDGVGGDCREVRKLFDRCSFWIGVGEGDVGMGVMNEVCVITGVGVVDGRGRGCLMGLDSRRGCICINASNLNPT